MVRNSIHRIIRTGVLAACVLLVAGSDQGWGASAGDEPVPIPHALTLLLRDATAQRSLGLRPEQIEAVGAALDEVDLPLWQLRDLPAEQRNEPAGRLVEKLEAKLATILSTQQQTRLDQVMLQSRSIHGLLEPAVAEKLKLSIGQLERMREVIAGLKQEMMALQQGGVSAREMVRARTIQGQAERNALALLDRDQQRTLRLMTGRSFDFSRVRELACRAPELRGVETWINDGPVSLAELRGSVVVVHFYTFGCINCIRNLPHYVAWQKHFASRPVHIVGIHRPETQGERAVETVRAKAAETGLTHSIAIDNDSQNWDAWGNHIWPAVYLIDKQGFVRHWWYGELNWQGTQGERHMRAKIEALLREKG